MSLYKEEILTLMDDLKDLLSINNEKLVYCNPSEIVKKGLQERSLLEKQIKNLGQFYLKNLRTEFKITQSKFSRLEI